MSSKNFWNTIKPFITNKSDLTNNDIMLIHNNTIITDENILTGLFNDYYINIVEASSGIKPTCLSGIDSTLQWKTQFLSGETSLQKRGFLQKNIRNAVLQWKRWLLNTRFSEMQTLKNSNARMFESFIRSECFCLRTY